MVEQVKKRGAPKKPKSIELPEAIFVIDTMEKQPEPVQEPSQAVAPTEVYPVVVHDEGFSTPPVKKPRKPRTSKAEMKLKQVQTVTVQELKPLNLQAQFDQAADVCTMPPLQDEPMQEVQTEEVQAEQVQDDAVSVVSDFEIIQNQATKELAYEARKQLKIDLNEQAQNLIFGHVGQEGLSEDQKQKIVKIVTGAYDDPQHLFYAIKHANSSELKRRAGQMGKIDLLERSKTIQKRTKVGGFKEFIEQRIKQR